MTVDEKIVSALEHIAPIEAGVYEGESDRYFVFVYFTNPVMFSNDRPAYEEYQVQAHYFCPAGYDSLTDRASARQALFSAGFTWPEEVDAGAGRTERGYTGYQHYVFECAVVEAVDVL